MTPSVRQFGAFAIPTSAVVTLLGSLATLAFGAFAVFGIFFSATQPQQAVDPTMLKVGGGILGAILASIAAWGIATGIALLLRRRWARISMLIFSILLGLYALLMAAVFALMPLLLPDAPPQAGAAMQTVRWVLVGFCLLGVGLAVWWLLLFGPKRCLEYFGGEGGVRKRPLGVSLIAWWLLSSAVFMPVAMALRAPAFILGMTVTGWMAALVYAIYGAAQLYLGWGLLKLREDARWGAIVFLLFTVANSAAGALLPGSWARMQSALADAWPALHMQAGAMAGAGGQRAMSMLGVLLGAVAAGFCCWYLALRRHKFTA